MSDFEKWVTIFKTEGAFMKVGVENGQCLIRAAQSGGWFQVRKDRASMAQFMADMCHFFGIKATIEGVSGAPIQPMDFEGK